MKQQGGHSQLRQRTRPPITPLESSRVGVLGLLEPGTLRGPGVENKIIISPQFRHGKIPANEPNKNKMKTKKWER